MPSCVTIFLAGGDGHRLRSLTRRIAGDDRPKQFCAVLGDETLFAQTVRRVVVAIGDTSQYCIVNRDHARFYRDEVQAFPRMRVIEQPANRGTGTAILYGLETARRDHGDCAVVGVFPTDHHVTSKAVFSRFLQAAYQEAASDSAHVYLVGAKAECPEADYGWIEASAAVDGSVGSDRDARAVRSFWEKPTSETAQQLFASGCLWNTFILIGSIRAFDLLVRSTGSGHPASIQQFFRGPADAEAFLMLPTLDFSQAVLQRSAENLRVLELCDAGWTDLGRPSRVNEVRHALRLPALAPEPAQHGAY